MAVSCFDGVNWWFRVAALDESELRRDDSRQYRVTKAILRSLHE